MTGYFYTTLLEIVGRGCHAPFSIFHPFHRSILPPPLLPETAVWCALINNGLLEILEGGGLIFTLFAGQTGGSLLEIVGCDGRSAISFFTGNDGVCISASAQSELIHVPWGSFRRSNMDCGDLLCRMGIRTGWQTKAIANTRRNPRAEAAEMSKSSCWSHFTGNIGVGIRSRNAPQVVILEIVETAVATIMIPQ